jgi:hypothetical protein
LQSKEDAVEAILLLAHVVARCATARYHPKREPKTLMLQRRCVAETNGGGKF